MKNISSPKVWAIFPAPARETIQELEKRIVTEWLPTSGFEFTEGADIEVYFNPDPQKTTYEVWIPVKKKETSEKKLTHLSGSFYFSGFSNVQKSSFKRFKKLN